MAPSSDEELGGPVLPVGSGQGPPLVAVGLTNTAGAQAILVRDGERPRLLLTAERMSGGEERLIIAPLDAGHEVRREGDALAAWIAEGSVATRVARVPAWASVVGLALVLAVLALLVLGALTFAGWVGEMMAP